jgi:hypothetical protein
MKFLSAALVVLAGVLVTFRPSSGTGRAIAHAQSQAVQGVVIAVNPRSLVIRAAGKLTTLIVTPATHVRSADNAALRLDSIRPGDVVALTANGTVRDTSQRMVALQGLVDLSPDGNTSPRVLVLRGAVSLVADISSATRYVDKVHATGNIDDVADGDALRLQGVYDPHLGEMTQTASVTRTGPILKRQTTHSGNG